MFCNRASGQTVASDTGGIPQQSFKTAAQVLD